MTARAVNEATFEQEVLNNDKAVLVDFWAEWCGPCRMVSPILDQIATEHAEKLDIVKLNVYVTDAAYRPAVVAARNRHFKEGRYPASTYLVVTALAVPQLLVEIEAVAMIE